MAAKNKKTVLIVDDNHDAADTLAMLVQMAGGEAAVVYDSVAGLALAYASPPDILMHDIGMRTLNGYEVARLLRQSEKLASTLLVAVTAYDRQEDRERAKEAGFDLHMAKPIEFDDLKELLNRPKPSN